MTPLQDLLLLGTLSLVRSSTWITEGSCEPCQCSLRRGDVHGLVKHVDCSRLDLVRVPAHLPEYLESLDLSFNKMNTATINSVCEFQSLQLLSLAYNPLTSFGGSPFSKCSLLVNLNLTGSGVTNLKRRSFAGLNNVQEIYGLVLNYVESGAFQYLVTLRILELTFIGESVHESIFMGLQVETMDLTLYNVTDIPQRLFQFGDTTLQFLYVYGPHVTNMHGDLLRGLNLLRVVSFHLPNLPSLPEGLLVNFGTDPTDSNPPHLREITVRGIKSITKHAFLFLGAVFRLSIHDVQDIAVRGLFDDLVNLEELNLTGCNVIDLPPGWFKRLTKLKTLDISDTTLRSLDGDAFYGPTNLSTVDLSMNALRNLNDLPFEPLRPTIRRLSFRRNILKTLDDGILRKMFLLQYLDLSDNKLSDISPNVFADLVALTDLRLQENKFYDLPGDLFRSQPHLETLHLGVNYFSRIPVAVTSSAIHLRVLRLPNNKIEDIPFSLHEDLPDLEYLSLQDNPLFCQCEMFSQRFYLPNLYIDAVCTAPTRYSRRHVMHIEIPDECSGPIPPQLSSNIVPSFRLTKPHISASISAVTYIRVTDIDDVGHVKWTYSGLDADPVSTQPSVTASVEYVGSIKVNVHSSDSVPEDSSVSADPSESDSVRAETSEPVRAEPSRSVPTEPVTTTAYPSESVPTQPSESVPTAPVTTTAYPSESVRAEQPTTAPTEPVTTTSYPRELTSFHIVTEPIASTDTGVAITSTVSGVGLNTKVAPPTRTQQFSPASDLSSSRVDTNYVPGILEQAHGNVFESTVTKESYTEAILYGILSFSIPVALTAIVVWIYYRRSTAPGINYTGRSYSETS